LSIVVATEQWPVVLCQRDEPIGCGAALDQRRADAEQLGAVVDQPVAVAIEREERLVAARPHPLDVVRKAVRVDVERHAAARGTQIDAVAPSVDHERTALCPDVAPGQIQQT
jgi:hypothetical protein